VGRLGFSALQEVGFDGAEAAKVSGESVDEVVTAGASLSFGGAGTGGGRARGGWWQI
jgi:hypothetical protein